MWLLFPIDDRCLRLSLIPLEKKKREIAVDHSSRRKKSTIAGSMENFAKFLDDHCHFLCPWCTCNMENCCRKYCKHTYSPYLLEIFLSYFFFFLSKYLPGILWLLLECKGLEMYTQISTVLHHGRYVHM